jgi:hypothetical protein
LVLDANVLHVAALATLARGSLETSTTAIWMIAPTSRDERITRALQWQVKNIKDGDNAVTEEGLVVPTPRADRLDKVKAVATAQGLDWRVIKDGYTSTRAVSAAQTHSNSPLYLLFAWRLCSGFAHGRPWAYLGYSELERNATANADIVNVKMSTDLGRILYLALSAAAALREAEKLFDLRASVK